MKGPVRRYSEGPWAQVSVAVDAAAETVWGLINDIQLPARFSSEFMGAEWTEGDGPALGASFVGHNRRKDHQWSTTSTVHVFDPPSAFGWVVGDPSNATATWRFDIAATAIGVRLSMWAQMGPGPSGISSSIERHPDREESIVDRRLDEWLGNMEATVEGIKALAESLQPDGLSP